MDVSIFGLGYVGAVCAACTAEAGHRVTGVDVSEIKVDLINRGRSPIVEPELAELMAAQVKAGRLSATSDAMQAVLNSEMSMICVGTPSRKNGDLDMRFLELVATDIGNALRAKDGWHTVVVRSTVLPGTVRELLIPILEMQSGKRAGEHFGVAVNPEFLRESTAVRDYYDPPMTVVGELDRRSGEAVASLYQHLDAPLLKQSIEVAEMVKYACNTWHATKITFANEIGNIAKAVGVDGREVMSVLCQDTKLNLSDYYMRPGFAFGGSCLPKDVRALVYRARRHDVSVPMLEAIMPSNSTQVARAYNIVESYGQRKVGMLGLSFKAGTDDLRESPLVELAEQLIGKGYELSIFDKNVDYARVHGANREYINSKIPHVSSLLRSDIDEVIKDSDLLVIGNSDERFRELIRSLPEGKRAIDLAGVMTTSSTSSLEGICW